MAGLTILTLAALLGSAPEVEIQLRAPVREARGSARARGEAGVEAPPASLRVPYNDAVPMDPALLAGPRPRRKLGTNTTIFVNFDGVTIGDCEPSNSHENCHWLEKGTTFEPYGGSLSQRVAILDGMRAQINDFGVRVTGQRPPADEPYMMVVYGGESVDEEALGRAPAGDCYDDLPNQIAYVYLDGERSSWVNGGASTALHESAHTWGFDHIGLEDSLMAPMGGNTIAKFFDGCAQVVENVDLDPSEVGSCPEISLEQCGLSDFQHDTAMLNLLFGAPYVDDIAPRLELHSPHDGAYFQAPAQFHVELGVIDDQHPQVYELAIGIRGLVDEPSFSAVYEPSFDVVDLPVGEWLFELRLRDAAGNEAALEFTVIVGDEPVELDDGCGCATGSDGGGRRACLGLLVLAALVPRRRGPKASARPRVGSALDPRARRR